MRKMIVAVCAGGLLVTAPFSSAGAAVYVHVDGEGTAHFTDAPTKPYFRPLPAFGLPRGVNLTRGQYADLINAIAVGHGVDPALVKAIIRAESGFDERAVSRKGAQGLMQLMPETAGRYAVGNSFDPADNIRGGVQYLRYLQDLFPGQIHLAIAAYNAGENAVLRYGGIPPFPETREYVSRVTRFYGARDSSSGANGFASLRPSAPRKPQPSTAPSAPSGSRVYRQIGADGVPFYTNVPPAVRSSQAAPR